ncbi:hypothetical protein COV05_02405 [Candidatus Uhrbacteria bacterium CG10_big_fil_rev_8_21_14_0_10_48_16]|uniref:Uncharacterized protein n=1 Tax=Candidatus Uhrbacteria bacterium CG10_big_fil_rev_8_21_14_0_10_48_16 TaxID=1975038 RepID=A0A2M8LHC8_9BACT|nr:MAG: hypothetical protein COV05_02405 [Candidatus Uhrbacteria bacterium CG10_big_fil_rev_8_21_14_0_10_48_16]
MKGLFHTITTLTTMITLVGCFFVAHHSMRCLPSVNNQLLLGSSCTAEAISNPTDWTRTESVGVIPSKEVLALVAVTLLFLSHRLFPSIKKFNKGLSWLHHRKQANRSGPAPNGVFLPYLFATHGW